MATIKDMVEKAMGFSSSSSFSSSLSSSSFEIDVDSEICLPNLPKWSSDQKTSHWLLNQCDYQHERDQHRAPQGYLAKFNYRNGETVHFIHTNEWVPTEIVFPTEDGLFIYRQVEVKRYINPRQ